MKRVTHRVMARVKAVLACGLILLVFPVCVCATDPLNVRDFGAAGDGVKDDTRALEKAISALPASGGTLLLPAGKYRIRKTLTIGDGSILKSSSSHNLSILGAGIGSTADSGFPAEGATELIWDGPLAGTMLEINGPISAVHLEGIRFSARDLAGTCLDVRHAYHSTFTRLQCSDFTKAGFTLTAYSSVPAVATGANHNRWEQIHAWSRVPGVTGVILGSSQPTGPGILAVSGNRFDTVTIHVNGEGATGIELRFTDFDTFTQTGVIAERGNGLKVTTVPGKYGFPGAVWFYQCSFIARNPSSGGHDWIGDQKIFFWPWHTGDGERVPVTPWAAGITSSGRYFGFWPW